MSEGLEQRRFTLAWEHFKFHAEQRTKMFHFFLLTVTLLVNAFALLLRADSDYHNDAFILLCIGGLFSTLFLCLDVRNTQLLEYSEALLRKIEEKLYEGDKWRYSLDEGQIKLGILSREDLLKEYLFRKGPFKNVGDNKRIRNGQIERWFYINNVKHKLSIRVIIGISFLCFWGFALVMAPTIWLRLLIFLVFAICTRWSIGNYHLDSARPEPTGQHRHRDHARYDRGGVSGSL